MNIQLVLPRTFNKEDMQPNTLYLDGAIAGTIIDSAQNSYSFDHHGDAPRFATRSTVAQIFQARNQGLDLSSIENIYVSSIDADSVVATWLATTNMWLKPHIESGKLPRFIDHLDRIDSHGPAGLFPNEGILDVCFVLTPKKGEEETTDLLLQKIEVFEAIFAGEGYDRVSAVQSRNGVAVALDSQGEVIGRQEADDISFFNVYELSAFGFIKADNGAYTIGKLPFAKVPSFKEGLFSALNDIEENGSWGGADSIGGSPMDTSSSLSEKEVIQTIQLWLTYHHTV